jgi:hypothetical protein
LTTKGLEYPSIDRASMHTDRITVVFISLFDYIKIRI